MKISIVTISFNQAQFIEKTLLSIFDQNYPLLEYIVVDAGSTDGSRDIIEKYRDKITKIIYEPDKGQAEGLNRGFSFATGDIFGFINSDDMLEPNALHIIANTFLKNDVDIVYGNGFIIDENGKKIRKVYVDKPTFIKTKYALGVFNFVQPSLFFTRKAFQTTGGFNESNKSCWDAELIIDMALKGMLIRRVNKFLSNFRLYDNSISGSGKMYSQYLHERQKILRKILGREKRISDQVLKFLLKTLNLIETPSKLQNLKNKNKAIFNKN